MFTPWITRKPLPALVVAVGIVHVRPGVWVGSSFPACPPESLETQPGRAQWRGQGGAERPGGSPSLAPQEARGAEVLPHLWPWPWTSPGVERQARVSRGDPRAVPPPLPSATLPCSVSQLRLPVHARSLWTRPVESTLTAAVTLCRPVADCIRRSPRSRHLALCMRLICVAP